jgi:hypothetical protein
MGRSIKGDVLLDFLKSRSHNGICKMPRAHPKQLTFYRYEKEIHDLADRMPAAFETHRIEGLILKKRP